MARAGIGSEVEGVHAVAAALEAGRVERLIVEKRRLDHADIMSLVERARSQRVEVTVTKDVRPLASTSAPQGVLAACEPILTATIDEVAHGPEAPALLVLDRLEDPRNVGAAARSAWAAGMTGLVVSLRRGAPIGATAFKAAVGALEHVPVVVVSSIADAVRQLSKADVWTVGLDGESETSLFGLELLTQPVAVCVGAEGSGLSRLVSERCDVTARIPMVGNVESLNASVASAMACYEIARVRGRVS